MRDTPYTPVAPAALPIAYGRVGASAGHACPVCGERHVSQIPRRVIDRFLGNFTKLRRFHCPNCHWQGNLPIRGKTGAGRIKPSKTLIDGLLAAVLVAILISLVTMTVMFSVSWFDDQFNNLSEASDRQGLSDSSAFPIRQSSPVR